MYFVLQTPSLQHLALVKIVAQLWTQMNIFIEIAHLPSYHKNEFKAIEEKVQNKVAALPLPKLCQKQLLNLIKPLGMEILTWCKYLCKEQDNFQFLENLLPLQLIWKMHGIIDYAKTAELMVKNERLTVEKRFELACINCLEDAARELIESMGEDQRQEYVKGVRQIGANFGHRSLIVFFTCTLIADEAHLHKYFGTLMSRSRSSLHKCLFELMLQWGTRATCEYLRKKIDQREKVQVLKTINMRTGINESSGDNKLYFLSLGNAEQGIERVSRTEVYDLLLCLLRWPKQPLFMEAAERGWPFMNPCDRIKALLAIANKICDGFGDYDYAQLFWQCWRLSPAEYNKRYFLCDYELLRDLLRTKREEFIKLVFNEGTWRFIKHVIVCYRDDYVDVITDQCVIICDALWMECEQTAALSSSNDKEDVEKRLRSQHLIQLMYLVKESRLKGIENAVKPGYSAIQETEKNLHYKRVSL